MTIAGKPTLCVLHTAPFLVDRLKELLAPRLGDAESFHMVDESLVMEARRACGMTPRVTRRIAMLVSLAEDAGADTVLMTCATTSPGANFARPLVGIPVIKIDEAIADKAAAIGSRIQIVCTNPTALHSLEPLVREKVSAAHGTVTMQSRVIPEAFAMMRSGDAQAHDACVRDVTLDLPRDFDVLLLDQTSMAHLADGLSRELGVPVLGCPKLAADAAVKTLGRQATA